MWALGIELWLLGLVAGAFIRWVILGDLGSFFFYLNFNNFELCVCVFVHLHTWVQVLEEGKYELPFVSAKNWTQDLCKSSIG